MCWNSIKIHYDAGDPGKQIAWRNFAGTLSAPHCRLRFIVEDAARSSSNETLLQLTCRDCRFDDGVGKAVIGRTAYWTDSKYSASVSARVFSSWLWNAWIAKCCDFTLRRNELIAFQFLDAIALSSQRALSDFTRCLICLDKLASRSKSPSARARSRWSIKMNVSNEIHGRRADQLARW